MKMQRDTLPVHTNAKETINIVAPFGAEYLSDFSQELPENSFFNKGKTGCGGSTIALTAIDRPWVVCGPSAELIRNKVKQANENKHNLYPYPVFGIYAGVTKLELDTYISNNPVPKIMVTYDSLWKLDEWIDTSKYDILIDEYHCLFTCYSFRLEACEVVLEQYKKYKSFTFMSATPLKDQYLFPEIKDIPVVNVTWPGAKTVSIKPKLCGTSVEGTVKNTINGFLEDTHEGNAYFFVNSTTFINKMIAVCNLSSSNTRVIHSEHNKLTLRNKIKRGFTSDDPKKINFITSAAFEGCDIYDESGKTFIVSDANREHTLLDISIQIPQIIGRIRNSKYCLNVVHIYSTSRHTDDLKMSFEEYCIEVDDRLKCAKHLLDSYNMTTGEFPRSAMRKTIIAGSNNDAHRGIEFLRVKPDGSVVVDSNRHSMALYRHEVVNGTYASTMNLIEDYKKTGMHVEEVEEDWSRDIVQTGNIKSFKEAVIKYLELLEKPVLTYDEEQSLIECESYPLVNDALEYLGYDAIQALKFSTSHVKRKLCTIKADQSPEHRLEAVHKLLIMGGRYKTGAFVASTDNGNWIKSAYKEVGWNENPNALKEIQKYMVIKPTKRLIKKNQGREEKKIDARGFIVISHKYAA